jgi:serine-type D-Ala-D-Ala carboxypeptidase/endopeptidase (penicillin-binding protein 4)
MNKTIHFFFLYILCLLANPTQAQPAKKKTNKPTTSRPEAKSVSSNEILNDAIRTLASDPALEHGQLGICVMDISSGEILGERKMNESLIPASNMKILTTAAGLSILGDDYTFRTELQYDGIIDRDGALIGNIYIKGYGDPTLGSPYMEKVLGMNAIIDTFAKEIARLGIKRINGHIVGDGTTFESSPAPQTWLYEDLGNYYGAGPHGLNFHENLFTVKFQQTQSFGISPTITSIDPYIPNLNLNNEVKSVNEREDNSYILGMPYNNNMYMRGKIPTGSGEFKIQGALPDPPYFLAWYLDQKIKSLDIPIRDSATTTLILMAHNQPMGSRRTFFTLRSPNLKEITKKTNVESVNLYAETIIRAISLQQSGEGSNDAGVKGVLDFWKAKGLDTQGLFMQDGSGLSPRNGITPNQLASILRLTALDNTIFPSFYNSLPEPGKSGTMKSMFQNSSSQLKLRAKSGTLTRVKCYSGYVTKKDGRMISFSVMANNFTCTQRELRPKLEHFMLELCRM